MSNRLPVVWDADPHTIAKIAILKNYLNAWFRILGMTRKNQTILYIDGFAGPGYYRNHDEGSPLAAVRAAETALEALDNAFIAKELHCAFIESRADRFKILTDAIAPFEGKPNLGITRAQCEFVDGIEIVRKAVPGPFKSEGPLLVFADPFGGTGIPFKTFAECMKSDTAELLINLDADGIGRIFSAENNNNRDAQLTELFGCEEWKQDLTSPDFKRLSVQILDLYKKRIRTLPRVKYVWSFAMRDKSDAINYHLVFATKHPLGLEKMKEAMKAIDKSGSYSFSDAHVDQQILFRDDNEDVYAEAMFKVFDGKTVSMAEAYDYALTETPFLNAKPLLAVLQKKDRLKVTAKPGASIRRGTFPEDKVASLEFGKCTSAHAQPELF